MEESEEGIFCYVNEIILRKPPVTYRWAGCREINTGLEGANFSPSYSLPPEIGEELEIVIGNI